MSLLEYVLIALNFDRDAKNSSATGMHFDYTNSQSVIMTHTHKKKKNLPDCQGNA